MCRTTWTPSTTAARGSSPRIPHLGIHRPAQLSPAHHPHGGPGLPCDGPQQNSHHWQDQVYMLFKCLSTYFIVQYGYKNHSLSLITINVHVWKNMNLLLSSEMKLWLKCKKKKKKNLLKAKEYFHSALTFFITTLLCMHNKRVCYLMPNALIFVGYGWTVLGCLMS